MFSQHIADVQRFDKETINGMRLRGIRICFLRIAIAFTQTYIKDAADFHIRNVQDNTTQTPE